MPAAPPPRRPSPAAPAGAAVVVLVLAAAGCGSGVEEFPTAPAGGTLLCGGTPLDGGIVLFVPQQDAGEGGTRSLNVGKQARGNVQPGGGFVLGTYGPDDGAVIGRHRVIVLPPGGVDEDAGGGGVGGCSGEYDDILTVTAEGPNQFTIDLAPSDDRPDAGEEPDDERN